MSDKEQIVRLTNTLNTLLIWLRHTTPPVLSLSDQSVLLTLLNGADVMKDSLLQAVPDEVSGHK